MEQERTSFFSNFEYYDNDQIQKMPLGVLLHRLSDLCKEISSGKYKHEENEWKNELTLVNNFINKCENLYYYYDDEDSLSFRLVDEIFTSPKFVKSWCSYLKFNSARDTYRQAADNADILLVALVLGVTERLKFYTYTRFGSVYDEVKEIVDNKTNKKNKIMKHVDNRTFHGKVDANIPHTFSQFDDLCRTVEKLEETFKATFNDLIELKTKEDNERQKRFEERKKQQEEDAKDSKQTKPKRKESKYGPRTKEQKERKYNPVVRKQYEAEKKEKKYSKAKQTVERVVKTNNA